MNKKGFISISVVYSFFLIFLMLLLFIVSSFVTNRVLLNNIKKEIKNEISIDNFARFLINESKDNTQIVNHDIYLTNGAKDNSYRYVGSNPDNYICFGTEATPCPDANLYRIIGVFGSKVKIIKYISLGTKKFDDVTNVYEFSYIQDYLNDEISSPIPGVSIEASFLENLPYEYANKIVETDLHVDGISSSEISQNIRKIYEAETKGNTFSTKVALPYVSDYLYATVKPYNNPTSTNNWLKNNNMLFLSPVSDAESKSVYYLYNGTISSSLVENPHNIYPTFYLKGSTKYASGTGTINNPYRVR